MFSQIKLYIGGFVLAVIGVLLALLKIQSSRLDNAKEEVKQQKVETKAAQKAVTAIKKSNEVKDNAEKIRESVRTDSATSKRDRLRKYAAKD